MASIFNSKGIPDEIYIVDLETTGLIGCPEDIIVEIGVCKTVFSENEVELIYSSVVGLDATFESIKKYETSWIFKNSNLKISDIVSAPKQEEVSSELREILKDNYVTSYNTDFDFHKFLFRNPWNMRGFFKEGKDIMQAAKDFRYSCNKRNCRFPRLADIYSILYPENRLGLDCTVHRAASDAITAAYVVLGLHHKGYY